MKHSEFARAVDGEFGAVMGQALVRDLVLDIFDLTAAEALKAGKRPREVWVALCHAMDVPESRIHGAGLQDPKE
jgi:poly(3-hydroxybutyrate) depolymerase